MLPPLRPRHLRRLEAAVGIAGVGGKSSPRYSRCRSQLCSRITGGASSSGRADTADTRCKFSGNSSSDSSSSNIDTGAVRCILTGPSNVPFPANFTACFATAGKSSPTSDDGLVPGLCPDLGRKTEPDMDALGVESLPLRWLKRDAAGLAALAYRHYRPAAAEAPPPRAAPPHASMPLQQQPPPHSPRVPPLTAAAATIAEAANPEAAAAMDVCILFCNGLKSHMTGAKLRSALNVAAACGCEFVCFDYSGFGASRGRPFEACGLQDWVEDAAALLAGVVTARRVVILGSSIGGWVALRLAQLAAESAPQPTLGSNSTTDSNSSSSAATTTTTTTAAGPTIAGLLLVAPAADLSEVRWAALSEAEQRRVLYDSALVSTGSPYQMDGGDAVGLSYFAQGRRNLLHCPGARTEPLQPGVAYPGPLAVVPRWLTLQPTDCSQEVCSPLRSRQTMRGAHGEEAPPVEASVKGEAPPAASLSLRVAAASLSLGEAEAEAATGVSAVAGLGTPGTAVVPACQGGDAGAIKPSSVGISLGVPVVILHGSEDTVVPLQHSKALLRSINATTTTTTTTTTTATTRNIAAAVSPVPTAAATAADIIAPGSTTAGSATTASLLVLAGGDHRLSCGAGLRALRGALLRLVDSGATAEELSAEG